MCKSKNEFLKNKSLFRIILNNILDKGEFGVGFLTK
jgi:hypothetical protein